VKLVCLGTDTQVVQHNISLGVGEVIRVELLLLGSLDLGGILGILVALLVTGRAATRDILKVRQDLLSGLGTRCGVSSSIIWSFISSTLVGS
jgi:hypothetical protein